MYMSTIWLHRGAKNVKNRMSTQNIKYMTHTKLYVHSIRLKQFCKCGIELSCTDSLSIYKLNFKHKFKLEKNIAARHAKAMAHQHNIFQIKVVSYASKSVSLFIQQPTYFNANKNILGYAIICFT